MRWVALALFMILGMKCSACALPVFRHALERWNVGDYRLEVPANESSGSLIRELLTNAVGNIRIDRIDESTGAVLFSPGSNSPIWIGTFDRESYKRITASPARTELIRRILSGDSAVWVLVAPEAERGTLQVGLQLAISQFESTAKLPAVSPDDLGAGPELKLKFSVLALDLNDPIEAEFISELAGTQKPQNAFIAPVFGRGRVLGVMKPDAATPKNIEQTCQFLIDSCSCQLDVGWDLLLAVDWNAELQKSGRRPLVSIPETAPQTVIIGSVLGKPVPSNSTNAIFLCGAIFLVLIGGATWMSRRSTL